MLYYRISSSDISDLIVFTDIKNYGRLDIPQNTKQKLTFVLYNDIPVIKLLSTLLSIYQEQIFSKKKHLSKHKKLVYLVREGTGLSLDKIFTLLFIYHHVQSNLISISIIKYQRVGKSSVL